MSKSRPANEPAPVLRRFLLLGGTHVERGVRFKFNSGKDTIVESQEDLTGHFPDRFEEIVSDAPAPVYSAPPSARVTGKQQAKKEVTTEQLGKEFTEQFPEAEEKGLRVFQRDGKFVVTTEDEPDKTIHPETKGFVKRSALEKFIGDYE